MKDYSKFIEEGLRIVDEDGVSFETDEVNELHHQEMQDLNIDHASELAAERYFKEVQEPNDYLFGKVHPYGRPYKGSNDPEDCIPPSYYF